MGAGQSRSVNRQPTEEPEEAPPQTPQPTVVEQPARTTPQSPLFGPDDLPDYEETPPPSDAEVRQQLQARVNHLEHQVDRLTGALSWTRQSAALVDEEHEWRQRRLDMMMQTVETLEHIIAQGSEFRLGSPRGLPIGSSIYSEHPLHRIDWSQRAEQRQTPEPRSRSHPNREPIRHRPTPRRAASSDRGTPVPIDIRDRMDMQPTQDSQPQQEYLLNPLAAADAFLASLNIVGMLNNVPREEQQQVEEERDVVMPLADLNNSRPRARHQMQASRPRPYRGYGEQYLAAAAKTTLKRKASPDDDLQRPPRQRLFTRASAPAGRGRAPLPASTTRPQPAIMPPSGRVTRSQAAQQGLEMPDVWATSLLRRRQEGAARRAGRK